MSTLNPLAVKLPGKRQPLNPHRPSFSKPLSLRITPPSLSHLSHSTVKASYQNHPNPNHLNKSRSFFKSQIYNEISNSMPIKSTLVTTIATAAIFLSGFQFSVKPSVAAPIPPPPTVESESATPVEEKAKLVEEQLYTNSDDIDELKNLVEIKVKSRKIPDAIKILDKLMELEPDEIEWLFLRAHLYAHNGQFQLSRKVFNEMLNKNPSSLDACQGLVNVDSQEESIEELKQTEKRIEEAIILAKENTENAANLSDFKLLRAQNRVLQGKHDDALNILKELEKEEADDFRVYLCQVLVYILLDRKSEAEISYEKYKGLVPEGHLFDTYFDDENFNAAKTYAQKVELERERKEG
ncbi:hypothetical protein CASFOL_031846 [Castilleja foliolosa]|uniref:Uncharacterized protein n=1 Tax=Castilleja foliolosa TaxID=1961234 RepID=A0ABD3BZT6_9LAMI